MSTSDFDPELDESEGAGSVNIGSGSIDPRDFLPSSASVRADFHVAVLLLETTSEDPGHTPLYEESFVLVKAESAAEAKEKAASFGKQQEATYEDEHHRTVTVKLKQVVDVKLLEDTTFDDGTELFSRFFRNHAAYTSLDPITEDD